MKNKKVIEIDIVVVILLLLVILHYTILQLQHTQVFQSMKALKI